MTAVRRVDASATGDTLRDALRADTTPVFVAPTPGSTADQLLDAALDVLDSGDGIATVSPVPVDVDSATAYPVHGLLPPAPSLGLPCPTWTVVCPAAIASLGPLPPAAATAAEDIVRLGALLLKSGWRNAALPGVAYRWDPAAADPDGILGADVLPELVGPANAGLETHAGWATAQLLGLSVVIDGACLDGDLHTGTQHVVLEVSRAMRVIRPDAHLSVAVPADRIDAVTAHLADSGIEVVDRRTELSADVLYRPYQMLRMEELDAFMTIGRRRLLGQLDMIGFSNPFYHPSADLFRFARNLQRTLLRRSDGVTFISEYGRRVTLAECPELAPSRLHVVGCGADPTPVADPVAPQPDLVDRRFLVMTSATFWHKNRQHAISTFVELVTRHGYPGDLVIVGPEPYHGSSTPDDESFVSTLDPELAARIRPLGQVADKEKWWLLHHADAVLYPSVIEGFGLVPFEAAAAGTPTLLFAGTAPGELLGGCRATIDVWDTTAWADRLATWLDDPDESQRVVEEVAAEAATLTWQATAATTWEAIDAALAQPSVRPQPQEGAPVHRVRPDSRSGRRVSTVGFTVARIRAALRRRVARWKGTR